jgi:hypothetical protein
LDGHILEGDRALSDKKAAVGVGTVNGDTGHRISSECNGIGTEQIHHRKNVGERDSA